MLHATAAQKRAEVQSAAFQAAASPLLSSSQLSTVLRSTDRKMRPPLAVLARSIRLDLAVRLRSIPPWAWLVLVAWGGVARAQEPLMFRGLGLHLTAQATQFGATILLAAASVGGPAAPTLLRHTVIVASVLVVGLGWCQAVLSCLLDALFPGPLSLGAHVQSWLLFSATWMPLSMAWVALAVGQGKARGCLQLVATLVSLSLAAPMWRMPGSWVAVAALASSGGTVLGLLATQPIRWEMATSPRRPPPSTRR